MAGEQPRGDTDDFIVDRPLSSSADTSWTSGTGSTTTRGRYWRQIRRALIWLDNRAKGWGRSSENLDRNTLLQRKLS